MASHCEGYATFLGIGYQLQGKFIKFSSNSEIPSSHLKPFTGNFFKATCYDNPGSVRKFAGSTSYISRHIFRKFSNTSANNNVPL